MKRLFPPERTVPRSQNPLGPDQTTPVLGSALERSPFHGGPEGGKKGTPSTGKESEEKRREKEDSPFTPHEKGGKKGGMVTFF